MFPNPITDMTDSMDAALTDAVQAAAAAPLNPVTLAVAVAAGLVMGLLVMRLLSDVMAIINLCAQKVEVMLVNKFGRRSPVTRLMMPRRKVENLAAGGATNMTASQ